MNPEIDSYGIKRWYLDGSLHRIDGPAIEDGTAIEWSDGTKYWYLNGKKHRIDGSAIEYADGGKAIL